MGVELKCSNCGDNLGKAIENLELAYCGQCGQETLNPRGSKAVPEDFMSHAHYFQYTERLNKAKQPTPRMRVTTTDGSGRGEEP